MMINRTVIVFCVSIILFAFSCVKEKDNNDTIVLKPNVENKSKFFDTISHHSGENCMNCHFQGGTGKGYFSIAGTVYDSTKTQISPNGTIRLFSKSGGQGDLKAEIQVDGRGNFFTTDTIDFSGGLYAVVFGVNGSYISMAAKQSSGQCSKCHGITQNNIWIK